MRWVLTQVEPVEVPSRRCRKDQIGEWCSLYQEVISYECVLSYRELKRTSSGDVSRLA